MNRSLNPALKFILSHLRAGLSRTGDPAGLFPENGESLLNALASHRLTGVFYEQTKNDPRMGEELRVALRREAAAGQRWMLVLTGALVQITRLLQAGGIRSVALKGPALGQRYYGDWTRRECNDLDILVDPARIQAACEILLSQGYVFSEELWRSPGQKALYRQTFHHYNLYHPTSGVVVELHWRVYSSVRLERLLATDVRGSLIACCLGGTQVEVMSSHDTFLYLCVHGGGHLWKRLFWLYDLTRIIAAEEDDFVPEVYQAALARGVERYVTLGCFLAATLYGLKLPETIRLAIQRDPAIPRLARIAQTAMNRASLPKPNPVADLRSLGAGMISLFDYYRARYHLGGPSALRLSVKRSFINPAFWRIHAFYDRLFFLNYLAAPFLRVYSLFRKTGR